MSLFSSRPPKVVSWRINTKCNFQCVYCFAETCVARATEMGHTIETYPTTLLKRLQGIFPADTIMHLSGGEPFLMKGFEEFVGVMSEHFILEIATNLSQDVSRFLQEVPSERVNVINASLHILEREKRQGSVEQFIERCLLLEASGFRVVVEYVCYPPLLRRLEQDVAALEAFDLEVEATQFQGTFQGKVYPEAYSSSDRALMTRFMETDSQEAVLAKNDNLNFMGCMCSAGLDTITIDPDGSVYRCIAYANRQRECLGNILTEKIELLDEPGACLVEECDCPFQGFLYADLRLRR